MIMPPSLMYLRIGSRGNRGFGLWLPLFLLWPIILVLFLIAMPFLLLADLVMMAGNKHYNITMLVIGALALLPETRTSMVKIHNYEHDVEVKIV